MKAKTILYAALLIGKALIGAAIALFALWFTLWAAAAAGIPM